MSNKVRIKAKNKSQPTNDLSWIQNFEAETGISEVLSFKQQVKLALFKCAQQPVPDYAAFQKWYSIKVTEENDRSLFPEDDNSESSIRGATSYWMTDIALRLKSMSHDEPTDAYYLLLTYLKLLISLHNDGERGSDFAGTFLRTVSDKREDLIQKPLHECSPAELRSRFFMAANQGDESTALKLIGALHSHFEKHDKCELDYLEAFCHFKSNDFDKAIEHANKVKSEAIDYKNALRIIIESNAYLGNLDDTIAAINSYGITSLTDAQLLLIYEVLSRNSPYPEKSADVFLNSTLKGRNIVIEPKDPAYRRFIKYHASLLIEYFERLKQGRWMLEADSASNAGVNDAMIFNSDTELELKQLAVALALDKSTMEQAEIEGASETILKLLLNTGERLDFESYFLALQAQFRLDQHHDFLKNVINLKEYLNSCSDERKYDLFALAYQVALTDKKSEADDILSYLKQSPKYQNGIDQLKDKASESLIARTLTPMGKHSYEISNIMLNMAMQQSLSWRDAGLIALGFFRVLEVELNARLIATLKPSDLQLSSVWSENRNQLNLLLEQPISKTRKRNIEKADKFWEDIIKQIKRISSGDQHGLVLGSLYRFLRKIMCVEGDDSQIKELFNIKISGILTDEGIISLRSGELAEVINDRVVAQYRNAPAHARFVSLKAAQECKTYVEDALGRMFRWFRSYDVQY